MSEKIFNYTFQDLKINKDDFLKTLSNPNVYSYEIVKEIVYEYFSKLESYNEIIGGYNIINSFKINNDMASITINNTVFNTDTIIVKQLENVEKVAVAVCTAGSWISSLSQKHMNDGNILEGFILDKLGSLIVEKAMDKIQKYLESEMLINNYKATLRVSPGYCGWNVSEQGKLFALLPENFCNIELTESAFMIPRKSLSGIIGVGKNVNHHKLLCNECLVPNCLYKNELKLIKKFN